MNDNRIIIGSDEAGKGEWLGPLTIAAVALSSSQRAYLMSQGVKDSKKLKVNNILRLDNIIKENSLAYHIIVITPEKFNRAFKIIKEENKQINLNHILACGHIKVINTVYKKLLIKGYQPNFVKIIIDEFDKSKINELINRNALFTLDIEQKPKAEKEVTVAAASILARAARERWINRFSAYLNVNLKELSPLNALNNTNVKLFAKINFIKKEY